MTDILTQNSDIILKLLLAMVLGMVIGAERLFVHKEAGIKTHALVAVGAAVFVLISEMLAIKYSNSAFDPSRIASQIIVGIGFLGAGTIMFKEKEARLVGLTTASGLWVVAGIGMAAGFGFYGLAIICTIITLFIFIAMNFIEKPIRKISDNSENFQNHNI